MGGQTAEVLGERKGAISGLKLVDFLRLKVNWVNGLLTRPNAP
jgi:hypothetical protein